ncbi:MAG: SagB/ThcOx family dehydrogenase [Candidatus Cloacimonetes bacterium]|nr:SagB/ThcOx family dehydrogenase [Candidatus Cloacimonadota bacterium]
MENLLQNREMLKSLEPYYYSDQTLGKLKPPAFKEIPERGEIIDLPEPSTAVIQQENIYKLISERTTLRDFKTDELSLEELSWLLWATQGVRKYIPEEKKIFRTVPSGGDRHPFETYLAVNRITGLNPGLYRFLSREHRLLFLKAEPDLVEILTDIGRGQPYVGNCAVCFIWSAIPQRTEWRYANQAKKNILIEAGHVGQNLYLATEAAGCGTCGIAAYDQKKVDELLELDGVDEFVIYLAPVGR